MDEELVKELQRLYSRAVEGCYTVKEVKDELNKLGIIPENDLPILEQIGKLIRRNLL